MCYPEEWKNPFGVSSTDKNLSSVFQHLSVDNNNRSRRPLTPYEKEQFSRGLGGFIGDRRRHGNPPKPGLNLIYSIGPLAHPVNVLIATTTKFLGSACHGGLEFFFFQSHASDFGDTLFASLWPRGPIILPSLLWLDHFFSFRAPFSLLFITVLLVLASP